MSTLRRATKICYSAVYTIDWIRVFVEYKRHSDGSVIDTLIRTNYNEVYKSTVGLNNGKFLVETERV